MIPVYYDESKEVWKKADSENKNPNYRWYDYDAQIWANSVTTTETKRATYQNANPGTEIPMSDILTMEVWVPRYKYKIFNNNEKGTNYASPKQIEITFEKNIDSTGTVKCIEDLNNEKGTSESCFDNKNVGVKDNISTYTHPAFTLGDAELDGIWVGKFEITGAIDKITTKPSTASVRNQDVSTFSTNIMKMNDANNIYGFSTNDDSHMIKNNEWGAISYLSHSKYGTCKDNKCTRVGKNSNTSYITGCGDTFDASESTTCKNYNKGGEIASTTGNVYGIYDMFGGAYEYSMGNTVYTDDETIISGNSTTQNSGFTGVIHTGSEKFSNYTGTSAPDKKYYDSYSYSTDRLAFQRGKLGDATKEVKESSGELGTWYGSAASLPNHGASWLLRGGATYSAGSLFNYTYHYGNAADKYSTRAVIVPKKEDQFLNICQFYGPYPTSSLDTNKSDYAYYGDKIYYSLYCTTNAGVTETISLNDLKSSNDKILKINKILTEEEYTTPTYGWKGYRYVIETEAVNYQNSIAKAYIYLDPYVVKDSAGYIDDGIKSPGINIGLLRINKQNNAKPILECNSVSGDEEKRMETVLNNKINKAGLGTRAAVVEAARFLAMDFPYYIPYYWTDGLRNYPDTGHYQNKGLFLNENRAWGCNITKQANAMGIYEIGGSYPNGLECSGFVAWALNNGGFGATGEWYTEIFKECSSSCTLMYQSTYTNHSLGYANIFEYYMSDKAKAKTASDTWKKLNPTSKKCIRESCGVTSTIDGYDIKAGDLIWKEGHIGLITGVKKGSSSNTYCVAEATYTENTSGSYTNRGLRTICYTTSELNKSSTAWTHIIKMDDIYGTGNLTNYKPYW